MKQSVKIFSKIPNNIFYVDSIQQENKISLLRKVNNDKLILVLDYLYVHKDIQSLVRLSLEHMILSCGFKPKTGINNTNEQFKSILHKLLLLDIISFANQSDTVDAMRFKYLYEFKFNLLLDDKFFILYKSEMDLIVYQNISNCNNTKLLLLYCYFKSRIYTRVNRDGTVSKDIIRDGGKANCCYPSYKLIADETSISQGKIKEYIDLLVDLNLIRYSNAGLWYYKEDQNKQPRESANTYVLYDKKGNWEHELRYGIKQYKHKSTERIFDVIKEYKHNNRAENGFIARIEKLMTEGKAKESDIVKYHEMISKREEVISDADNEYDVKFKLIEVFKKNDSLLLSDYYDCNAPNEKLKNYYLQLENKLGLVDENGILMDGVSFDYYKWVMMNYNDVESDMYVNYVKKRINDYNEDFEI